MLVSVHAYGASASLSTLIEIKQQRTICVFLTNFSRSTNFLGGATVALISGLEQHIASPQLF